MSKILNIIVIGCVSLLIGCAYDKEDVLYPVTNCDTVNVSFANVVLPLLESNCTSCHNPVDQQGGLILSNYTSVYNAVQRGRVIGAITHQSGYIAMPQSAPKMLACNIDKITAWINQGAKNN